MSLYPIAEAVEKLNKQMTSKDFAYSELVDRHERSLMEVKVLEGRLADANDKNGRLLLANERLAEQVKTLMTTKPALRTKEPEIG